MFKIIKERKVYMYNTLSTPYDIDFSLPYSIDKKSKNIFVPTAAIDILLNIAYLSHRLKLVGSSSFTGPKLIIEYQDIEGKTKKSLGKQNWNVEWHVSVVIIWRQILHYGLHLYQRNGLQKV